MIKTNRLKHIIFSTFLIVLPTTLLGKSLIDTVSSDLKRSIIDYFENEYFDKYDNKKVNPIENRKHHKSFVYCNYYGMTKDSTDNYRVFVKCVCNSYYLKYDQIFEDAPSCNGFFVIHLKTSANDFKVDSIFPGFGGSPKSNKNLKQYFPLELQDKMFRTDDECHLFYSQKQECEKRIKQYYGSLLTKNRLIYIKPPENRTDIHGHHPNIYDYLNVKETYTYLNIIAISKDSMKEKASETIYSQDKRFKVWMGAKYNFHLYFEDCKTNKVYEILNTAEDMVTNRTWKDNNTLSFDQVNGYNRYDKNINTKNNHFGVHIEVDLKKKKIIWAVPIGELAFPVLIESNDKRIK